MRGIIVCGVAVLGTALPTVGVAEEVALDETRSFWSFQPPVQPAYPPVVDESWVRNGIDRFILHRLEAEGLAPAPEAGREQLFRRLSLDLTGLPPSPDGLDLGVAAGDGDPCLPVIDQLLASPRFGERMASFWMPVARYAEDQPNGRRVIFSGAHFYRQWVIDAFNRDLPYDEFVRKQLAADLYEDEQHLPALGFLALGPYPPYGSTVRQLADAWADRVDLVTRGFLGLSVACARCHDHLDDPITAEDYYAFAGIFASIDHEDLPVGNRSAHIVTDAAIRTLRVFRKGDPERPGELMPRRNIRLLSPDPDLSAYRQGSGRRQLAEELTSRDNPLLARVMVNRVWGEIFGRPLVTTPSNFGRSGEAPSHPELLDYLAVRFMDDGWSVKRLVREMVNSATYRQEAIRSGSDRLRLFAGMERRRLTAEMLRDSMLVATGEIDHHSFAGSSQLDDPGNLRRTVFGAVSRMNMDEFLQDFDYPDPALHAPQRTTTITPAQKLYLLNSAFVQARAAKLADRLDGMHAAPGLDALFRRVFARRPTPTERDLALQFIDSEGGPVDERQWMQLGQVMFSSNAFLYRD